MNVSIEVRPERLLPPAASMETHAARGVCHLCGLRTEECDQRLVANEARLDVLLGFFGLAALQGRG